MNEPTPETLAGGRYELVSLLGEGGMASVWRAYDARLEVDRAIKVLSPRLSVVNDLRARFETEARTMARLQHPNIVAVHDVAEDGQHIFIVMELLEGGTLAGWLERNGPMPPRMAVEAMRGILGAMGAAHEAGVVHRDIKPQNVLLSRKAVPKVTDFGIAHVAMELGGRPTPTRTGMVMGTYGYMSPEQRSGQRGVDARADVFSLGATLYGLLTAQEPPDLFASAEDESIFAAVPPLLVPVLERATRYKPDARYASAGDMLADLERVLPNLPPIPPETPPMVAPGLASGSTPTSEPGRRSRASFTPTSKIPASATLVVDTPRGTIVAPSAEVPTTLPPAPGSNRVALLAGAAAVLALGVAAFALMREAPAPAPSPPPPFPAAPVADVEFAPSAPVLEAPAVPEPDPVAASGSDTTPGGAPAASPGSRPTPRTEVAASAEEAAPAPIAPVEPASLPAVPEPTPEPVPAPAPVVADAAPEPAPAPVAAAATACLSSGTYEGKAQGRPFTLIVQSVSDGAIRAKGRALVGQAWRDFALSGSCSGTTVTLKEAAADGMQFRGFVGNDGRSISGQVSVGGRDSDWSVRAK